MQEMQIEIKRYESVQSEGNMSMNIANSQQKEFD
jgi:hypothetical protein